jgi:hypothetical protein
MCAELKRLQVFYLRGRIRSEPQTQKRENLKRSGEIKNPKTKKVSNGTIDASGGSIFRARSSQNSPARLALGENPNFFFNGESLRTPSNFFWPTHGWFLLFHFVATSLWICLRKSQITVDNTLPCVVQVRNESERSQENKARTRG